MKCKKVVYERLVNTGNFSHEKFGVEIELEENEKAGDAIQNARKLITRQLNGPTINDREIFRQVVEFDEIEEKFPI